MTDGAVDLKERISRFVVLPYGEGSIIDRTRTFLGTPEDDLIMTILCSVTVELKDPHHNFSLLNFIVKGSFPS